MGNTKSVNVAKAVVDLYSDIGAKTVQNSKIESSNTQIISVSDNAGDVVISGNTITQKATLNMSSLMNSISNVDSQLLLSIQLDQLAKSLVSGLNFLTFADAKNTAETLIKSQTKINNAIKQSCTLQSNNLQSITINKTQGGVTITNNVLSQITEIFDKCALKSVLGVKEINDIQTRIDQTAESKLEGFNLVWVVIAVLAFILVPVIVGGRVASKSLKYIFPLMGVAGAILFSLYFVFVKTYMKSYNFTKPFTCPQAIKDNTVGKANTTREAIEACLASKSCKVVDSRVTIDGVVSKLSPEITYYSSGESCPINLYEYGKLGGPDVTAVKTVERSQWMLYVSIAMMVGGFLGFLIQNRRGQETNDGNSVGSIGESPIIINETSV